MLSHRYAWFAAAALLALAWLPARLRSEELTSLKAAERFWNAFLDGDTQAMGRMYAEKVVLKAGSELLKQEYGINPSGNRDRDLLVDRQPLANAYIAMFDRVGKAKWQESAKRLRGVRMTFITQADENRYFALFQASPGDVLVQLHTTPEPLFFLLRQDAMRNWWVVAESFD